MGCRSHLPVDPHRAAAIPQPRLQLNRRVEPRRAAQAPHPRRRLQQLQACRRGVGGASCGTAASMSGSAARVQNDASTYAYTMAARPGYIQRSGDRADWHRLAWTSGASPKQSRAHRTRSLSNGSIHVRYGQRSVCGAGGVVKLLCWSTEPQGVGHAAARSIAWWGTHSVLT
jgi:hypothetical protein